MYGEGDVPGGYPAKIARAGAIYRARSKFVIDGAYVLVIQTQAVFAGINWDVASMHERFSGVCISRAQANGWDMGSISVSDSASSYKNKNRIYRRSHVLAPAEVVAVKPKYMGSGD
jgi:hypothetical protein